MGPHKQLYLTEFFEKQRARLHELDAWKTPALYTPSEALAKIEELQIEMRGMQTKLLRQHHELEAMRRQLNHVQIALESA